MKEAGMSDKIIDIADLDCIYLSYDEPRKEEFWSKINSVIPWAKRVDNVKGSDAAHKAAAAASDTERFILIDGDNLPNFKFFDQQLTLNDTNKDYVFRWKAYNNINGLTYGNGGLSCWTKTFINNMKTHEASLGEDHTTVEFCWNDGYIAMNDVWSTTYPNQSPYHAWRAGFREGVKMCLDRGVKPSLMDFQTRVSLGNMRNLSIWHNIGADAEYGNWGMLGARMGTYLTMLDGWDHKLVHDFDELQKLFDSEFADLEFNPRDLDYYGNHLNIKLGLDILLEDAEYSRFFKKYSASRKNKGIMIVEGEA
jgi:hypothetical protein